ncbi:MAG: histidinol-phosphate transaminase [Clostridiales bacterium]|nr:histidinol-phosphate transaminase [Candidatus Equinaster intestinalis]
MSRFFSSKYSSLVPYTPGEQPQDKKYIKLNTNESPFPPSVLAQRLARQAAGDLRLYPDPDCNALKKIAADRFNIAEDEIIFTNGSDDILNFAFMAFCDDKTPAAFANITYGFYKVFANLNGVEYTEIPLDADFKLNPKDYYGLNKTIFIANPNAPTGIALSKNEIEGIVAANPENIVVVDEAYVDFGAESSLDLIHKYDNLLVCQTFSKSRSLAGGRIGFGVASKELINDLNTVRYSTNPYNINRMTMSAAIGALTDEKYFKDCCKKIADTREYSLKKFENLGFTFTDSKTNFVFVKHPKISGKELYLTLKENGVLIRHFDTDLLRDYNRITIGSREEMDEFFVILEKVLKEKI